MKVLHLSSEKSWRGGEQQIAYLIEELLDLGAECHIISKKGSVFSRLCVENNWSFEEAGFNNSFDLPTAIHILRYCKKHQIDIVHIHGSRSHTPAVLAATLGSKSGLVLSRRVDFPLKRNFLSKWKYNHPSIKRVLCVSDKIREIVQETIKNRSICQTVYDGIDISKFGDRVKGNFLSSTYSLDKGTWLVGNTSALADHKDYYTFINTAREIVKEDIPTMFFIIGTGPMEAELKGYVEELGLQNKIVFTGFIDNISEVLPELDVFLMTSKTEGLGTSILDAMAAKVPVVATEGGGIPEIVKDRKTGLTSKVGDYHSLARQVIRVLKDEGLRNTLTTESSKFVEKFDKKIMAAKTLEVYNDIIKNSRGCTKQA
ncbi:MAG: glycosyltransferase family 4 protein [Cyclobacteriaceae bacterium]